MARQAPVRVKREATITFRCTHQIRDRLDQAALEVGQSASRMAEEWMMRGLKSWLEDCEYTAELERRRSVARQTLAAMNEAGL